MTEEETVRLVELEKRVLYGKATSDELAEFRSMMDRLRSDPAHIAMEAKAYREAALMLESHGLTLPPEFVRS
ncbi:MAG TPA: hypothetical protein VLD66_00015 [Methyloceanibacter sp.]|nr:hypothetical protein [Methyloceanibacter sp.]